MYRKYLKPFGDRIFSLVLLLFLFPILLVISIFLWITNRGMPFFIQERPGFHGEIFKIIKFKTMTDERDKDGSLLPDHQRLTLLGRIVRKTSADELPQLVNILKGEMSFIGPRPLIPEYLPFYTKEEQLRHDVKPGISGLAQINGRNTLGWNERLAYDVEYVKTLSFKNDIWIVLKSVAIILSFKSGHIDPMANIKDLSKERKDSVFSNS
ncbi:sugar transferase [Ancylomarina sp. 16SWW S1-10-2]|uniref:sugar transferase n=1 Tax=Ancylomarina sp. 16SWW S1-10-2 TaxID=2499681 RepID=UPI0012AD5D29|nr:sugar transferase [Ancylomarina sp. 16SWW S1-10-2]MRT93452.1 sugar transferase [Ancylomarina sp. 16SWW S1-10-2]